MISSSSRSERQPIVSTRLNSTCRYVARKIWWLHQFFKDHLTHLRCRRQILISLKIIKSFPEGAHMKFTIVLFSLLSVIAVCNSTNYSSPQTIVVQPTPKRDQTQSRQVPAPEKKSSSSKSIPEDLSTGEPGRRSKQKRSYSSTNRRSPLIKRSITSGTSGTSGTNLAPETTPTLTPANIVTTTAKPSPASTMGVTVLTGQSRQNPISPQHLPQPWLLPGLAILSFLVLIALIYVILKLMEKLREGQ